MKADLKKRSKNKVRNANSVKYIQLRLAYNIKKHLRFEIAYIYQRLLKTAAHFDYLFVQENFVVLGNAKQVQSRVKEFDF